MKFASPIIASTVEVGTPLVQLEAVLQFVLVVPFQDVCEVAEPKAKTTKAASTSNRNVHVEAMPLTFRAPVLTGIRDPLRMTTRYFYTRLILPISPSIPSM